MGEEGCSSAKEKEDHATSDTTTAIVMNSMR